MAAALFCSAAFKIRIMSNIYNNVESLIGKTPLLRLEAIEKKYNLNAKLYAKLEFFNPTGSAKDRAALGMILAAEQQKLISKGGTIIEPTSGNTGIAIASIAASRGYKAVIVMPSSMSRERQLLMRAYGAEVELTDAKLGMAGAIAKAKELNSKIKNSFIPSQFDNFENKNSHFNTTAPEIYDDLDGEIDVFAATVGTGGTLSGIGEYLKLKLAHVRVVAIEPKESALLSGMPAAPHKIQGIGANFIPAILNQEIYDEVISVSADEAYAAVKSAGYDMGLGIGISAGAALAAVISLAKREELRGKNIVTVFPDGIDRYLSTDLFD